MLAYVEHRTAKIWCEVEGEVSLVLRYWPANLPNEAKEAFKTIHKAYSFETVEFDLVDLKAGMDYHYQVYQKK